MTTPQSPEDRICHVCGQINADLYGDTMEGRLFFHEKCLLTPEETQAMIALQRKYRDIPGVER
jgi:hypothetical protein